MTRLAWYKRYPADFREGTRKLSFEERGFYGDVLDLIYESGNALVDDDADNAHHLRADLRTYRRLKARLVELGKLYLADGMVRNGRADAEATAAATRIAMARDHGKLGGEKARKSVAKSGNFNGSGGAGAQADAQAVAPTGIRYKDTEKKETHAAAPRPATPAHAGAREETAPAGPAAAADDASRLIIVKTGCDEVEAAATWTALLRFAGGDEDLAYYGLHRALRKGRDVLAYAGSVIRGELVERQRPAPPPAPYVDVLELAKDMARKDGLYDPPPAEGLH
jgi:uncharacterized protein YdaU (DUF1376 family)